MLCITNDHQLQQRELYLIKNNMIEEEKYQDETSPAYPQETFDVATNGQIEVFTMRKDQYTVIDRPEDYVVILKKPIF